MVTKTRRKTAKENEYRVRGIRGQRTITARNVREAVNKAVRLYPRARILGVERKPSRGGKEYETYWIKR